MLIDIFSSIMSGVASKQKIAYRLDKAVCSMILKKLENGKNQSRLWQVSPAGRWYTMWSRGDKNQLIENSVNRNRLTRKSVRENWEPKIESKLSVNRSVNWIFRLDKNVNRNQIEKLG